MPETKSQKSTNAAKPNVWQRINSVRDEVRTVGKDASVDNKYKAVTHDAVNRMLRPLMVKHGLVDSISIKQIDLVDTGVQWGKRPLMQYRGQFSYMVTNIDDPTDCFIMTVDGYGDDNGDKGPGKAITYAFKTARLKVFSIDTGEDDEQRPEAEDITEPGLEPDQLDQLMQKADDLFGAAEGQKILDKMAGVIFNAKPVDIPAKGFDAAMKWLDRKAESMKPAEEPKEKSDE